MNSPRFVLDTNLVVQAALLEASPARHVFETALAMPSTEPAFQVGSWVLRRLHTGWVRRVLVTAERCT